MMNVKNDNLQKTTFSLVTWWKRSKLSQSLKALDDRMLEDIGIQRHEIKAIVEKSFPRTSFLTIVAGMLDKMVEAHKNREAAWELAGLDDRLLADMGLYRSDISSISKGYYPQRHIDASPLMAYGSNIASVSEAVNDDHKRAA